MFAPSFEQHMTRALDMAHRGQVVSQKEINLTIRREFARRL
jgi:hypothetical protein